MRLVKKMIRKSFGAAGLEIARRKPNGLHAVIPPPLLDDYREAVYEMQGGGKAAFRCPIGKIVVKNGFAFGSGRWNPFEATMAEFARCRTSYPDSVLRRYYEIFTPQNALEALLFTDHESELSNYPSYTLHTPFTCMTVDEAMEWRRTYYRHEMQVVLDDDTDISEGFKYHGPVSQRIGEAEFTRCVDVYRALRENGYLRPHGDVGVMILRRGDEERFLLAPGHHRVAAMAALGMTWVPAFIKHGGIFHLRDLHLWPQVRRGVWKPELAEAYFHHLFDFNSRQWAVDRGLWVELPDE